MLRELELKIARHPITLRVDVSSVVLCENAGHAARIAHALSATGARIIDGSESGRGTLPEHLGRRFAVDRAAHVIDKLHLPQDILEWRTRDLTVLQRMLVASLGAVLADVDLIVFDVTKLAASPFDVAHAFAHLARLRSNVPAHIIALIADPALLSSAGSYLVVMHGDEVVESGALADLLARPASEPLQQRLAQTPIASPLAMQLRHVQRASTTAVNYAHTQIIALPTKDSVALAGGEE